METISEAMLEECTEGKRRTVSGTEDHRIERENHGTGNNDSA